MGNNIAKFQADNWAMDRVVTTGLVEQATGPEADEKSKRFFTEEIRSFAEGLAGPDRSPIVVTLARTAALAWFAMRLCEHRLTSDAESRQRRTIAQADHMQRQVDRAHRRYLATLKTLATVRRLAIPTLQINLAGQQVNVAGPLPLCSNGGDA